MALTHRMAAHYHKQSACGGSHAVFNYHPIKGARDNQVPLALSISTYWCMRSLMLTQDAFNLGFEYAN
jgi:hypothetical protein